MLKVLSRWLKCELDTTDAEIVVPQGLFELNRSSNL